MTLKIHSGGYDIARSATRYHLRCSAPNLTVRLYCINDAWTQWRCTFFDAQEMADLHLLLWVLKFGSWVSLLESHQPASTYVEPLGGHLVVSINRSHLQITLYSACGSCQCRHARISGTVTRKLKHTLLDRLKF